MGANLDILKDFPPTSKAEWRDKVEADLKGKPFDKLIKKHEPGMKLSLLERFAFYERVHGAYAVIQTGERRLYGNVLLKKGIVRPE